MKVEKQFASLDASTFMVNALSTYLKGKDSGHVFPLSEPLMRNIALPALRLLSLLPNRAVSEVIKRGGMREGLQPGELSQIDAEAVAAYTVSQYPERQYPTVAIGSANGAITFLCAAMGIPWLPQAFLVLGRRDLPPDELTHDVAFGAKVGEAMLRANPHIALYQMCDPANDRYMSQKMTYFRVKHLALPAAYTRFIRQTLEPGGTIIVVECQRTWPAVMLNDRHFYQVGGVGGTTIEEYYNGSDRVRDFLAQHKTPHERFIVPEPTHTLREAEWGFDERLHASIAEFAAAEGYQVKRLSFGHQEAASPMVANLYRRWYQSHGLPADVVSFKMYTPFEILHTIRAGVVPFWLVFNGENSLHSAERYLSQQDYRRILLTLFSNYVPAPGIPPTEEWKRRLGAELVGVKPEKFPFDPASPVAYLYDFQRKLDRRYPEPPPLTLAELEAFLQSDPLLADERVTMG